MPMSSTKGVDEKMKRKSKTYHQCRKLAELAFIAYRRASFRPFPSLV